LLVLVTRPSPAAEATARRLASLGYQPLIAPLLSVAPTGQAPPDQPIDAILLTSANAATALAAAPAPLLGIPVFAVGGRTAEAARSAGFPEVRSADGDSRALADLARSVLPAGSRLLHVAGRDRKAEPAHSLRQAGFEVAVWEAYEARAASALPQAAARALANGRVGAVLHYSRRTAEILLALAGQAGLAPALAAVRHVCLSEDVAQGLVPLGPVEVAVAAAPREHDLFIALGGAGMGSWPPQSGC
jgi:uroporphyrinogen-III synthase